MSRRRYGFSAGNGKPTTPRSPPTSAGELSVNAAGAALEALREPGFNVLESTPYAKLAKLNLTYDVIGCDELLGLNKTDRKMMREAWGEPKAHTTAHALYGELWREQESKLAVVRNKRRADRRGGTGQLEGR